MRIAHILVCAGVAWGATAAIGIRDIHDQVLNLFRPAGKANVLFFVSSDCPVSNSYAPEIQRLCGEYRSKGVGCSLLYEDVDASPASIRKHLDDYRYSAVPAVIAVAIDGQRTIAKQAHATVTPEAVVIDSRGEIRYRGRIDNFYAALGKPRQQVTEHDLRDALESVLAGRKVANPETRTLGCYIVPPDILTK
jgi:thiol-disulfide isomerase/thioredoxin